MPIRKRLSSILARMSQALEPAGEEAAAESAPADSTETVARAGTGTFQEDFQKVHRGVRRLSLASDRGAELLEGVVARLDGLQQTMLAMNRSRPVALELDETDLLLLLDRLDRIAQAPELPATARGIIGRVTGTLLTGARWQPVTQPGVTADGADIRIAEYLGAASGNGAAARVHRVLEQGYRRTDGTLLRPAVVVAAGGGSTPINARHATRGPIEAGSSRGHAASSAGFTPPPTTEDEASP